MAMNSAYLSSKLEGILLLEWKSFLRLSMEILWMNSKRWNKASYDRFLDVFKELASILIA